MATEQHLVYFQEFGTWPLIGFRQLNRNTSPTEYIPEPSTWIIAVITGGKVIMNGNAGINPYSPEMLELAEVIKRLAQAVEAIKTATP